MGGASNLASLGLNLALSQQAQQRQSRQIRRERNQDLAQNREDNARRVTEQTERLRRQVAQARARAGGSGLLTTGGSIDAVLRGLERDTNRSIADINSSSARNEEAIRNRSRQRSRRSLLDFSSRAVGFGLNSLR